MGTTETTKEFLTRLGWIYTVGSGIQVDVTSAWKKVDAEHMTQASLCNFDCTNDNGGYDCPAATSVNKGIIAKSLASTDTLVEKITIAADGIRLFQRERLPVIFERHYAEFQIPVHIKEVLQESLRSQTVEVNLFGGNSELFPGTVEAIARLRNQNLRVNLTTTGWKFLRDDRFTEDFFKSPPHVLALSADDFELEELARLLTLNLDKLKTEFNRIKNPGQPKKACAALYAAKLINERQGAFILLFNMVLHKGNIRRARAIIKALEEAFPKVLVNPYPGQIAFYRGQNGYDAEEVKLFEKLVDYFIERTVGNDPRFVKRLQYWLLLKAACLKWQGSPEKVARSIGGYGIWRCYKRPGAGRYLQMGRSTKIVPVAVAEQTYPGLHPGCYWTTTTVTDNDHKVESPEQVAAYLDGGMTALSQENENPCPGCAMPRLLFDGFNVEAGMDDDLIPDYLKLRKQHVGF